MEQDRCLHRYHVVLLLCGGSFLGSGSLTLGGSLFGTFLSSLSGSEGSLVSSLLGLASGTLGSEFLGVLGDHLKGNLDSDLLVQAYDGGVLARGLHGLVHADDLAVNIVTSSEQSLVNRGW